MSLFTIVREFAFRIKDGRSEQDIFKHLTSEFKELEAEVAPLACPGEDGIVGEAVDLIQCGLDLIFKNRPNITEEELDAIMRAKCEKWERVYWLPIKDKLG